MIYWTSYPDGDHADPCGRVLDSPIGPTAADLAAAVSTAPGTELVSGPSDVTLGGRPAKHVVLTVLAHVGCDPGFFFRWRDRDGGALWTTTGVGATIRVWIVDVHGTRLFIAAASTRGTAGRSDVEEQIQKIVGSIRFERPSIPASSGTVSLIDLRTGKSTRLPGTILRSLGDTPGAQWRGSRFAVAPHGERLAYVGNGDDGTRQVFIARIDGTWVHQVTNDPKGATSPAWSPDGTKISYSAYGDGDVRNLFVRQLSTGEITQVTDEARDVWDSQFTPNGSSLLYTGGTQEVPLLMTAPVAGGSSRLLLWPVVGLPDSGNGSISPDGSLVTFLGSGTPSSGDPSHCGPCRWVANADGTDRRVILGCVGSNPAGTWSPDGSRIVCSYGGRVVVVDIATGDDSPVAEGSGAIWIDRHTLLIEGSTPPVSSTHGLTRTVAGVRFSLRVPTAAWANGPITSAPDGELRAGRLLISKSIMGSQGAEAVIYWTAVGGGPRAEPCGQWWGSPVGSVAEFAANASRMRGTELVKGPADVTLDGYAAKHVVLVVRQDLGCDPGFFYSWRGECWGPCWMETVVGDTIRVWIVDVKGTRLFIAAETTRMASAQLEREIQQIIGSIRFD